VRLGPLSFSLSRLCIGRLAERHSDLIYATWDYGVFYTGGDKTAILFRFTGKSELVTKQKVLGGYGKDSGSRDEHSRGWDTAGNHDRSGIIRECLN
jgi:hypothetical protein